MSSLEMLWLRRSYLLKHILEQRSNWQKEKNQLALITKRDSHLICRG